MHAIWRIQPADPPRAGRLADELGVDPITAQLLLNRGVQDRAQGKRFLDPRVESLGDPLELPGMERAVRRLRRAIAAREPIVIFGDSDADGLTAGVILYETLRDQGAAVRARQSNRITDGYGLPRSFVQRLCRSSTKLLLLVDCGTNQPEDVRRLAACGIDTIIVDHHVPLNACAKPAALLNPHCDGGGVAWRGLSSAGLAFKLAQALLGQDRDERLAEHLDLAALGTLADCSPLIGEARILVAEGLPRIVESRRPGLRRLCEATKVSHPDPDHVVKRLVPRLNASGRLGDAAAVWTLLLRKAGGEIERWMAAAEAAHATTKQLHRRTIAEAEEQVNRLHFRDQFVMVVSRSGWPQGLMGPLASRLAERYGRPAIAIAMHEHHGVGSGRSIPVFNLLAALQACQELLVRFGGHAQACGLTLDRKQLEPFRAFVNQEARRSLGYHGLLQARTADCELPLAGVARRWVEEAERFAPFGYGNPRPTVIIRGLAIEAHSPRRATLSDGTTRVAAAGRFAGLAAGGRYDVVASPAMRDGELALTVSDVRDAEEPSELSRISGTTCRFAPAS